jgi:hypothetical protein
LLKEGVSKGERNSTIASLAGYLFWHDMDPQVVLDLLYPRLKRLTHKKFFRDAGGV